MSEHTKPEIRAIIGLGNPGPKFTHTRHNAGFLVVDELAEKYHGSWQEKGNLLYAQIAIADKQILLIKPLTYMNESGKVIPFLQKKGIKPEEILVIHDELEKPFGKLAFKQSGSHRGHNGLRSIIGVVGPDFYRLRFGIGRPERKEDVADYVLARFDEPDEEILAKIDEAASMIEKLFIS